MRMRDTARMLIVVLLSLAFYAGVGTRSAATEPDAGSGTIAHVYYVDPARQTTSDDNPGLDRAWPLRTIQAALDRARRDILAGRGARILIGNGTYREGLSLAFSDAEPATGAPLVIEAEHVGSVTVSGSDVFDGWQPLGDGLFAHSWPHKWGFGENPWTKWKIEVPPLALRGEIVFVDGERLRQVLTEEDLRAAPLTFLVEEEQNRIVIHLAPGVSTTEKRIEASVRGQVLNIRNGKSVTIRGIRFQHGGMALRSFAVLITGSDISINKCEFIENNDIGLRMETRSSSITSSVFSSNGTHGLSTTYTTDLYVGNSELSYNNWRGSLGGFYSWDAANKQLYAQRQVWDGLRVLRNDASGLWFDTGNKEIVVKNSVFVDNLFLGLFIEASEGPFSVHNNVFCANNARYQDGKATYFANMGSVHILESQHIDIFENTFYDNTYYQLVVGLGGERMTPHSIRFERNNVILGNSYSAALLLPAPASLRFHSDDNTYYADGDQAGFHIVTREPIGGYKALRFAEWQRETGQDQSSSWSARGQDENRGCPLRVER